MSDFFFTLMTPCYNYNRNEGIYLAHPQAFIPSSTMLGM